MIMIRMVTKGVVIKVVVVYNALPLLSLILRVVWIGVVVGVGGVVLFEKNVVYSIVERVVEWEIFW